MTEQRLAEIEALAIANDRAEQAMKIEQAMREDSLTGIEDVGIKIIKEIK